MILQTCNFLFYRERASNNLIYKIIKIHLNKINFARIIFKINCYIKNLIEL